MSRARMEIPKACLGTGTKVVDLLRARSIMRAMIAELELALKEGREILGVGKSVEGGGHPVYPETTEYTFRLTDSCFDMKQIRAHERDVAREKAARKARAKK